MIAYGVPFRVMFSTNRQHQRAGNPAVVLGHQHLLPLRRHPPEHPGVVLDAGRVLSRRLVGVQLRHQLDQARQVGLYGAANAHGRYSSPRMSRANSASFSFTQNSC